MRFQRSVAAWAIVLLVMAADVQAQNGKGSTPNGRPFQQIQSQFAQLHQRLQALETHVNGVERALRAQIAGIDTSLTSIHGRIGSIDDAVTAIHARIDANEEKIGALSESIGSLDAALVAVQTDLSALQNDVAGYASDTADNATAILALQRQAAQLASLIQDHATEIESLQGESESVSAFLAKMADATCSTGDVVNGVSADGSIRCVKPAAAGGGVVVDAVQMTWTFGKVNREFIVGCPAGFAAMGGGFTGTLGIDLVGMHPVGTTFAVRVNSPLTSAVVTVYARCLKVS